MRNVEDFIIPPSEDVTLCEINGHTQYTNYEYANLSTFTTQVDNHPRIHVSRETLQHSILGDEGKDLFLPTDVPFLKHLTQVYSEDGLQEVLQTASAHSHFLISKSAMLLLKFFKSIKKAQLILDPSLEYIGAELIDELNQTRNWANNMVRCLAWHPNSSRLAVATSDEGVRIYSCDSNFIPLLRCKQQKNVTCLAWRPMSLTEIAVGHETGIIIWNVDFNSLVVRPSISNAIILHRIEHQPVLSLSWSSRGDILASAAARDSNILVWNVELNQTSSLKGCRDAGNILLRWSSTKDRLLSVSSGLVFKIWDCQHWESDRWTVLSGHVQSACWTNCGTNLLFTTNSEPIIYGLTIRTDSVFTNSDTSITHAVPLFDLNTRVDLQGRAVGGIVQSMETDPKGKHLAVLFKETNCVALFGVTKVPTLQLIPSSLVVGLAREVPSTMCFQQNFKAGACLTIAWSSGRIQHFPIIYSDLEEEANLTHSIRSLNNTK